MRIVQFAGVATRTRDPNQHPNLLDLLPQLIAAFRELIIFKTGLRFGSTFDRSVGFKWWRSGCPSCLVLRGLNRCRVWKTVKSSVAVMPHVKLVRIADLARRLGVVFSPLRVVRRDPVVPVLQPPTCVRPLLWLS